VPLPIRLAAATAAVLLAAGCTSPLGHPPNSPRVTAAPGTMTPYRTTPPTTSPTTLSGGARSTSASPGAATSTRDSTVSTVTVAQVKTATAQLASLTTAARGPRVKEARDLFGPAWKDVDKTHCDQRNEALARALRDRVFRDGSRCVVISGVLDDPYSGQAIQFQRGRSLIDIDHVVPLGHAIRVGAAGWTQAQREAFAGDLDLELLPVSASLNRQKGDAPPDGWLPPNKTYRCAYALRWIQIKTEWHLTITDAERATLTRLIAQCRPVGERR
jgi:Protein of unknown function (DUF1524)